MSYEDWLRRKADQHGHSEILAFQMMILGMNLLVGGFIVTMITTGQIMDLQSITQQSLSQSSAIGLILTGTGFLILSAGFVMVVYYDRKKSWHLGEIEKAEKVMNRKYRSISQRNAERTN